MGFNPNNEHRGKHAAPPAASVAGSVGRSQEALGNVPGSLSGFQTPQHGRTPSSANGGSVNSGSYVAGYRLPIVQPVPGAESSRRGATMPPYANGVASSPKANGYIPGGAGSARFNSPRRGSGVSQSALLQSRGNVASYTARARRNRRRGRGKHIAGVIAAVLLCFVLAGVGYGLWFSNALNNAFSTGEEGMSDVLTPANDGEPFYMLVLGSDSREGSGTSSKAAESGDNQRSDVMILLRVDAANKKVTMVSIPRDTPYRTSDGSLVKINEAYNIGGAAESVKAVSQLTGVGISHYAEVHFSELESIVDKLGGVEVNVDIQLSYTDALTGEKVTLQPGKQTLNGQQAQLFARARHEYQTDQDKHRQDNVRQLALAIVNKVLEKPLYEMPQALLDVAGFVGTDMRTGDILSLATAFAGGSGSMTVYSASGPSSGAINEESGGLWLCYENPEGWSKLMKVVDAGEDPSGLDLESTAIIP